MSSRDGGGQWNLKLGGFKIGYHLNTIKISRLGSFQVITDQIGQYDGAPTLL